MKKRLLILGMITCLLGLTACGAKDATEETSFLSREEAMQYAESVVTDLNQIEEQGAVEDQISAAESQGLTYIVNAVQSWDSAQEELGDYIDITGSEVTAYEPDSITVVVTVKGSLHDAEVEVIMGQESYQSITTTIQRSFGELMKNAALNTLLGMGTVFVVLILIMFIESRKNLMQRKRARHRMPPKTPLTIPWHRLQPRRRKNLPTTSNL